MRDLASKLGPPEAADPKAKKGAAEEAPIELPKEFLVPPVAGPDEEPGPEAAERAAIEKIVDGPFPDNSTLNLAKMQAFLALFAEEVEQPGKVTLYEEKSRCEILGKRLKCEQLEHVGQGVEFLAPDAEPGALSVLVVVNVSSEYICDKARWKIVYTQDVPFPPGEDPPPAEEAPAAKGKKK